MAYAIERVLQRRTQTECFITGHGEHYAPGHVHYSHVETLGGDRSGRSDVLEAPPDGPRGARHPAHPEHDRRGGDRRFHRLRGSRELSLPRHRQAVARHFRLRADPRLRLRQRLTGVRPAPECARPGARLVQSWRRNRADRHCFSRRAGFAGDGPPAGKLARSNGPADPLRCCRLRDLGSDHRPSQLLVSGSYSAYSLTHPIGPFSTPGEHTREIVEGLLGFSHEELRAGFADGTFWPAERPRFPYQEEMLGG